MDSQRGFPLQVPPAFHPARIPPCPPAQDVAHRILASTWWTARKEAAALVLPLAHDAGHGWATSWSDSTKTSLGSEREEL